MLNKLYCLSFILFLSLSSFYTQAQVETTIWIHKDSLRTYQPNDIIRLFPQHFTKSENRNLNYGLDKNDSWFVVDIKNNSNQQYNGRLVIDFGLLNYVHFYEIKGVNIKEIKETSSSHAYIYGLNVDSNTKTQYLLHVTGNQTPTILPIKISNVESILIDEVTHTFQLGIFYGILFFLLTLIIIINFIVKDRFSQLLLLYIIITILFFGFRDGFALRLNLITNPDLQFKIILIFIPFLVPLLEQFLKKYFRDLEITFSMPKTQKIIHLVSVLLILLIASGLFQYKVLFYITYTYVIISLPLMSYSIIRFKDLTKTLVPSIWVSLHILLIGIGVDMLHKLGYINNNFLSINFLKFAFLIHIGVFLIGVINRFQFLRKKALSFNENLAMLVKEKTAEINQQNEELTVQTEQLGLQKEELESQKEELQSQKEILEDQNKRLEKLDMAASNTENVIYIFDPNGKLLWFNGSFSSQLGHSFNEYQKLDQQINIRDISSYPEIGNVLDNVKLNQESFTYEAQVEKTWFQTTLTPIRQDGEVKHIVAIDTDITRLKNYEQKIIEQQQDFEQQKNLAVKQRKEVELQQREITDSLNYAKRIQHAILPNSRSISKFFSDSFVLFIPRDIVSGDFYWFHRIEDKYIYLVVDCTGHGVPGAFMSIIGTYLLNNIIIQNKETRPAEILKQLNRKLKISLKNTEYSTQTNDGMDVALVVVDKAKDTLSFAGALRPLFLFQNGQFIEQKGDKIPITSVIAGNTMANFNEYTYKINEGDSFYLFSDGIVDQFGGSRNKKFLTKRLKQVLFDAQMYKMEEQKKILQKSILTWKGDNQQIDDILMVGVKI